MVNALEMMDRQRREYPLIFEKVMKGSMGIALSANVLQMITNAFWRPNTKLFNDPTADRNVSETMVALSPWALANRLKHDCLRSEILPKRRFQAGVTSQSDLQSLILTAQAQAKTRKPRFDKGKKRSKNSGNSKQVGRRAHFIDSR
jgi:hypothetical protein